MDGESLDRADERPSRRSAPFGRVLDLRIRNAILVILTLLLATVAVVIGLPSRPDLPEGLGRIVVIPQLPSDPEDVEQYRLTVAWHEQRRPGDASEGGLLWDTFWSPFGAGDPSSDDSTAPESMAGLPVFLAVRDEAAVAWLRSCAAEPASGAVTEVAALPTTEAALLDDLDLAESGDTRSHTYFRLDDKGVTESWWFSMCDAAPGATSAGDEVEMHSTLPELAVLLPPLDALFPPSDTTLEPGGSGAEEARPTAEHALTGLRVQITATALPIGWSEAQMRAVHGSFRDEQDVLVWDAVPSDELSGGRFELLTAGPVVIEAISYNASRQADRNLFWSGLLVGLAGSCALMLFETIPWRRHQGGGRGASEVA